MAMIRHFNQVLDALESGAASEEEAIEACSLFAANVMRPVGRDIEKFLRELSHVADDQHQELISEESFPSFRNDFWALEYKKDGERGWGVSFPIHSIHALALFFRSNLPEKELCISRIQEQVYGNIARICLQADWLVSCRSEFEDKEKRAANFFVCPWDRSMIIALEGGESSSSWDKSRLEGYRIGKRLWETFSAKDGIEPPVPCGFCLLVMEKTRDIWYGFLPRHGNFTDMVQFNVLPAKDRYIDEFHGRMEFWHKFHPHFKSGEHVGYGFFADAFPTKFIFEEE